MYQNIYRILLFFTLSALFPACADMEALSSEARITGVVVNGYSPEAIKAGTPRIEQDKLFVIIPLEGSLTAFPATLDMSITTDGYVSEILGDDMHHLVFERYTDTRQISLITQSGVPVTYHVKFAASCGIRSFEMNDYKSQRTSPIGVIDPVAKIVSVWTANTTYPFSFTPAIVLANGLEFVGYTPGTPMEFSSGSATYGLTLRYPDGLQETWHVQLLVTPQLENAGLNQWCKPWGEPNTAKEQPCVSKNQLFWCTTNDPLAGFGTIKITGESGAEGDYAAQLRTEEKGALGIRRYGAASLFTGFFQLDLSLLATPEKMARMGRPFLLRPAAVNFSAQYTAGPRFTRGNPPDDIEEPGIIDRGACHVSLESWTGADGQLLYNYTATTGAEYDQLTRTVVGSGSLPINNISGWTRLSCPVTYDPAMSDRPVTHIVVNFSSSIDGANFRVAVGSVLKVDNVEIVY